MFSISPRDFLVCDHVVKGLRAAYDPAGMSSGASWDEDDGDPSSDITPFGAAIVFGYSQDDLAASLTRDRELGTDNRYNSTDTQVLGMLLVRTTGGWNWPSEV